MGFLNGEVEALHVGYFAMCGSVHCTHESSVGCNLRYLIVGVYLHISIWGKLEMLLS